MSSPSNDRKVVKVCGLGLSPREDATLEVLQALVSCRAVLTDLADPAAYAWLTSLCPLRRAARADDVLEAARAPGAVGLAVWGHPLLNSALGREVVDAARRAGVACEVFAGVSPLGAWLARDVRFLGGEEGVKGAQAVSLETALAKPALLDSPLPLVVFSEKGGEWGRLAREIAKHRFRGRRAAVYAPPSFERKDAALDELAGAAAPTAAILVSSREAHDF